MGALVAGLSIAAFPYSVHVTAKTLPLRDFFLTLFFMSLGMKITAAALEHGGDRRDDRGVRRSRRGSCRSTRCSPAPARAGGRRSSAASTWRRSASSRWSSRASAWSTGTSASGRSRSRSTRWRSPPCCRATASATTTSSSSGSTASWPGSAGARAPDEDGHAGAGHAARPVALLGFHRVARAMIDSLAERSPHLLKRVLVIDFNPEVLAELKARGIAAVFGDISSLDTLEHHHLEGSAAHLLHDPRLPPEGDRQPDLDEKLPRDRPRGDDHRDGGRRRPTSRSSRRPGPASSVKPYELSGGRLARYVREWSAFGGAIEMAPRPSSARHPARWCRRRVSASGCLKGRPRAAWPGADRGGDLTTRCSGGPGHHLLARRTGSPNHLTLTRSRNGEGTNAARDCTRHVGSHLVTFHVSRFSLGLGSALNRLGRLLPRNTLFRRSRSPPTIPRVASAGESAWSS